MLTGQSGILTQAKRAREDTRGGEVKDAVALAVAENELAKNTGNGTVRTKDDIVQELAESGKLTEKELAELEKSDKLTIGSIEIDFSRLREGQTEGERITGEEIVGKLKEYQGSYVDIGLDTNDTNETTDDWEIFYAVNESGENRIFLIAADYVPVIKLESWKIIGTGTTLANLGDHGLKQYSNYTYSVNWGDNSSDVVIPWMPLPTVKDVDFMKLVKHTQYNLSEHTTNRNAGAVSQLLNTTAWSGVVTNAGKSSKIEFAIGGPTLEMWCTAWNAVVDESDGNGFKKITAGGIEENTGYYVSSEDMTDQTYLYMNGTTSPLSNLSTLGEKYPTFFPHADVVSHCYGYWLASPSASNPDYLMFVYYRGFVHYSNFNNGSLGVRPVVCLKSGVQLQERETKEDGTTIYDLV